MLPRRADIQESSCNLHGLESGRGVRLSLRAIDIWWCMVNMNTHGSATLVDIEARFSLLKALPLSFQHLMAMFGATVLVPLIYKVNPAIALLKNGIDTLIYSYVTKGGIPAYLGSSFAFIAPTLLVMSKGSFSHAQSGFIFFGLFFIVVSFVVRAVGTRWIEVSMPAPVMGGVVAVIGLELAPVAAQMAGLAPLRRNKESPTSSDVRCIEVLSGGAGRS